MDSEPTVHDAIAHYIRGKLMVLEPDVMKVWVDAFRGYRPLPLLEAARASLKFEAGPPAIEKLQKHYQKQIKGEPKTREVETYSILDIPQDANQHIREIQTRPGTPEDREKAIFDYLRERRMLRKVTLPA